LAVPGALQEEALAAVQSLDAQGLESVLSRAAVLLGAQGLLEKLAVPLAHQVGELWRSGDITAAHEHFASAVLRVFLGNSGKSFATGQNAPNLVVGTPTGQLHELGAVIVAAGAASLGWRVTYLGAALPAAEIAGAAMQNRSRAVALSIVYPEDDPDLAQELTDLRRFLPAEIRIIAGGRAASAYRKVLSQIGAIHLDNLERFYPVLDSLRTAPPAR
jgi:methanogenic corrinoid protein MtbC1